LKNLTTPVMLLMWYSFFLCGEPRVDAPGC